MNYLNTEYYSAEKKNTEYYGEREDNEVEM